MLIDFLNQEIFPALDCSHAKDGHFKLFSHLIIIQSRCIWLIPERQQLGNMFVCPCSVFNVSDGRLSFCWRYSISTWLRRWMSSLFTYTTHCHAAFQHRFKFNNSGVEKHFSYFSEQISGIIPLHSLPAEVSCSFSVHHVEGDQVFVPTVSNWSNWSPDPPWACCLSV